VKRFIRMFFCMLLLLVSHTKALSADRVFIVKDFHVIEGDILGVQLLNSDIYPPEKIYLFGIDCPEPTQPYGLEAKKFTEGFTRGAVLKVKIIERDFYGRLLAEIYVGKESLAAKLLESGLAWVWKPGFNKQKFESLEVKAKIIGIGLWKDPNPVSPWSWRRR